MPFLTSVHKCARRIAKGVLLLVILGSVWATAQESKGPRRLAEAKISDCAACHTAGAPLPKDHPPVAGMALKACQDCHAAKSPMALLGKLPLSHIHQLAGVGCAQCHVDVKDAQQPPAADCMKCHDAEKVAAATEAVKPHNPHDSPHYGRKSDCNLCHHQHEKSENYCSQCHSFKYTTP